MSRGLLVSFLPCLIILFFQNQTGYAQWRQMPKYSAQFPPENKSFSDEFPERNTDSCWSPGNKLALISVHNPVPRGPTSKLYLQRQNSKVRTPVIIPTSPDNGYDKSPPNSDNSFERTIYVMWSPTGRKFAINDHSQGPGSISNVFLYNVDDVQHPINVRKSLLPLLSKKDRENFNGDLPGGSGIDVVRWIGPQKMLIESYGTLGIRYEWDLGKSLKKLSWRKI